MLVLPVLDLTLESTTLETNCTDDRVSDELPLLGTFLETHQSELE